MSCSLPPALQFVVEDAGDAGCGAGDAGCGAEDDAGCDGGAVPRPLIDWDFGAPAVAPELTLLSLMVTYM